MKKYVCKYCHKIIATTNSFVSLNNTARLIDHLLIRHPDKKPEYYSLYISDIPDKCYAVEEKAKALRNKRSCILVSCKDAAQYSFSAYSEADDFLGRRSGYIRACLRNGNQISKINEDNTREYFDIIEGPKNKKYQNASPSPEQLCWYCKNACGGCSWSSDFIPIPGWVAEKTIKDSKETYSITDCPLFRPENVRILYLKGAANEANL